MKRPALLLTLLAIIVPVVYVGHEHLFYYWDYASYEDQAIAEAAVWKPIVTGHPSDLLHLLVQLRRSTANPYSNLHAALSAPVLTAFGASRITYVLGLTLTYLLPYALAMGALAARLLRRPGQMYWPAAFLTLLLHRSGCRPCAVIPILVQRC